MTNTDTLDLMAVLTELQKRYPDWRFAQLICNVAGWADVDIWDVEDRELLAAAREHLRGQQVAAMNGQAAADPSA
jgi:hypothetical protein